MNSISEGFAVIIAISLFSLHSQRWVNSKEGKYYPVSILPCSWAFIFSNLPLISFYAQNSPPDVKGNIVICAGSDMNICSILHNLNSCLMILTWWYFVLLSVGRFNLHHHVYFWPCCYTYSSPRTICDKDLLFIRTAADYTTSQVL